MSDDLSGFSRLDKLQPGDYYKTEERYMVQNC
jgi:hypothetical protein